VSSRLSLVFLSPHPEKTSEICVEGERQEVLNPSLEELISVLDETERLFRILTYRPGGGC
jgi:hypothetical protein